jgi:biotin carboxylase
VPLYLIAVNPTDSVTDGFLPAAGALGLKVTVLTNQPAEHRAAYAGHPAPPDHVIGCDVHDFREIIGQLSRLPPPDAIFSNSDHLQTQTALTAEYFGLPGKNWPAAMRTKNKAQMRRHLAAHDGDLPVVWSAELPAEADPAVLVRDELPYPCVVKPREGVASEDVVLVADAVELVLRCREIQTRRPGAALVVEEFVAGQLHTLETLGDGKNLWVLGGFRTAVSAPPYFIEENMVFDPQPPAAQVDSVLAQLAALGVGFGACHTEYVLDAGGQARLVEVNYRVVGDQCDLLLADLFGYPLFERVLRVHLGEPLPGEWQPRPDARARIDYVCADASGTLVSAPEAGNWLRDNGIRVTYRPVRELGARRDKTNTNRDYLGMLRVTGADQAAVDAAAAEFLATRRWEIQA